MTTANLNNYRMSPRKVRLVSDLVKGKSVEDALALLGVTVKSAAKPLSKLIRSAAKSAKDVGSADEKTLFIKDFRVDAGATLKRSMPRARGSAYQILKRTSKIQLVLGERAGVKSEKSKVKSKNQ